MSPTDPSLHNAEPAKTAARWIELVELIRVSGRMFRGLLASHLQKHSLGQSQFSALWLCERAPRSGLSQQDITAKLAVSPAAVSGLVEQLRRRGLLEGRRAETDRRRQLWRLTPDGKDVLDAVLSDLAAWAASLQSELGRTDPDDLLLSIGELARALSLQAGAGSLSARVVSASVLNPCVCESADRDVRADTSCREGAA